MLVRCLEGCAQVVVIKDQHCQTEQNEGAEEENWRREGQPLEGF